MVEDLTADGANRPREMPDSSFPLNDVIAGKVGKVGRAQPPFAIFQKTCCFPEKKAAEEN